MREEFSMSFFWLLFLFALVSRGLVREADALLFCLFPACGGGMMVD